MIILIVFVCSVDIQYVNVVSNTAFMSRLDETLESISGPWLNLQRENFLTPTEKTSLFNYTSHLPIK
jgi:hypothetical protein